MVKDPEEIMLERVRAKAAEVVAAKRGVLAGDLVANASVPVVGRRLLMSAVFHAMRFAVPSATPP